MTAFRPQSGPSELPRLQSEASAPLCAPNSLRILAVGTEWSSGHGGLSTFNRQLCRALAAAGAKVVCLVLEASPEDRLSAGEVTLVEAKRTPGQPEHESLSRKPKLPDGFDPDIIVGHGRVTGPAARILAEDHFPNAKRLHFVHMAPDEIEWFKLDRNDDAGARAEERTQIELDLGRTAARVVAVGPRLHDRYLAELHPFNVPVPIELDPGFDGANDDLRGPPPGAPWKILVLGRLEDSDLKGIDLAAKAVGLTMERREGAETPLELIARGARPDTSSQVQEKLRTWSGNPALNIVVRPFTTNAESIDADIRRASLVLMPSRREGFGLVGLEAIVAGTPVLISSESGLGELLKMVLSQEQAFRIIVRTTGDSTKDQDTWARAVEGVLRDREAAFRRASEVRTLLAASKTWAGAVAHLLSELGPIGLGRDSQSILGTSKEINGVENPCESESPGDQPPNSPAMAASLPSELKSDPDTTIRCIDDYEPSPDIFGRNAEIETVVDAMLRRIPVIVAGGPGMGKTSVVTAALYDPRIMERFGRRRVFASLEAATEPRAIASKLVETLGIPPIGDEATLLRIIATSAAERPIAAVLDNAETVFDSDRAEAERLLNLVVRIKGLSVAMTIRGVPPSASGAALIDNLPKLDPAAAREAFLSIAGASFAADPDLLPLLDAFDGHALSICLVAAQANGLPSLQGLRESWDEAHAEILRRPGEEESRLNSVRASLALSLASRRMKSNPFARRLLSLLGFLPAGLPEQTVVRLLGDRGMVPKAKANDAIGCLHQLRLVERRLDGRLRMLTPLRESVKKDVSPVSDDKRRLINRYLELAMKANAIGKREWESVRVEVENEADNLDSICEVGVTASVLPSHLDRALRGLASFHIVSGLAAISSLGVVLTIPRGKIPPLMTACCILDLGKIAFRRSDYDTARVRYKEALVLFQSMGSVSGEANCIQGLGELARVLSDHKTARARYEEALALYQRIGSVLGKAHCIHEFGTLASMHCDDETALAKFEEARALYQSIGDLLGEANCIRAIGHTANERSDHQMARARFDEALTPYRRVGDLLGEAFCIQGYGDIATAQSDHETALTRYADALVLYRRVGGTADEATMLVRSGQAKRKLGDASGGLANIKEGFALYFEHANAEDRALDGWRALHRALTCHDTVLANKYREDARVAWAAIERFDFVRHWVDRD